MIDSFKGKYWFLSNFYPQSVFYKGRGYRTVEHAYQAAKTRSPQEHDWVRRAKTPGLAKYRGRQVQIRSDWESIKLDVMFELIRWKFQSPELRAALLGTGDEELVEGNSWGDRYWGIYDGEGENHLGKILMQVREEIRRVGS